MTSPRPVEVPAWLRIVGVATLAILAVCVVYALAIGLANYDRIGV